MTERTNCFYPDYWDEFQCKGGACRSTCCEGWNISISQSEYYRLIGMTCSDGLHARLEGALAPADEPTPERFAFITPNWLGDCPMHGEDGLCMLHKECGPEALPSVCRLYPRSEKRERGAAMLTLSASCEAVTELLIRRREPIHVLCGLRDAEVALDGAEDALLPKRAGICLSLLEDRSRPLAKRLDSIGFFLMERSCLDAACPRGEAAAALARMLEGLLAESPSLKRFAAAAVERCTAGDMPLTEDIEHFRGACADSEVIFENLLVGHMLYADFPALRQVQGYEAAFRGLACVYGAMLALSAAQWALEPGGERLADVMAGLFRCVEHSAFYRNAPLLLGAEKDRLDGVIGGIIAL